MAPAAGDKAKADKAGASTKWSMFKPSTWGQSKKVKVAHLPDGESNMYYHPELKRWVERGKEDEAANDPGNAPPPTGSAFLGPAQRSASTTELAGPQSGPSGTRKALSSRYVLQNNLSVSSSTSDLVDAGRAASSTLLPPGVSPSPRDSTAGGTGPPAGPLKGFFIPPASTSTDGDAAAPVTKTSESSAAGGFKFYVPPATAGGESEQQGAQGGQQGGAWSGYASSGAGAGKGLRGARAKRSSTGASGPDSISSTPPLSSTGDLPGVAAAAVANGWPHAGYASEQTQAQAHDPEVHGDASANGTAMHDSPPHAAAGEAADVADAESNFRSGVGHTNSWGSATGHSFSMDTEASSAHAPANGTAGLGGLHADLHSWQAQQQQAHQPYSLEQMEPHAGAAHGADAMHADGQAQASQQLDEQQPDEHQHQQEFQEGAQGQNGEAGSANGQLAASACYGSSASYAAYSSAGESLQAQCSLGGWAEQNASSMQAGGTERSGSSATGPAPGLIPAAGLSAVDMSAAATTAPDAAAQPGVPAAAAAGSPAAASAASALHGAAKGLHTKGRELFGALAGYVASSGSSGLRFASGGGGADGDGPDDAWGFDAAMHPGCPTKLDGPLPWELPEHLRYSDEFLSFCTAWQRNNPGKTYSPELLLPVAEAAAEAAVADVAVAAGVEGAMAGAGVSVETHQVAVAAGAEGVVVAASAVAVTTTVVAAAMPVAENGGDSGKPEDAWLSGYLQRKQQQEAEQQQQQQQRQQEEVPAAAPQPPLPAAAVASDAAVAYAVDAPVASETVAVDGWDADVLQLGLPEEVQGMATDPEGGTDALHAVHAVHTVGVDASGFGGVEQGSATDAGLEGGLPGSLEAAAGVEQVSGQFHWGGQQQLQEDPAAGSWFDSQGSQPAEQHLPEVAGTLAWEQQQQQRWDAYYAQQQLEAQQQQQQQDGVGEAPAMLEEQHVSAAVQPFVPEVLVALGEASTEAGDNEVQGWDLDGAEELLGVSVPVPVPSDQHGHQQQEQLQQEHDAASAVAGVAVHLTAPVPVPSADAGAEAFFAAAGGIDAAAETMGSSAADGAFPAAAVEEVHHVQQQAFSHQPAHQEPVAVAAVATGVADVADVAVTEDPEAHAVVDQVVSDLVSSLDPSGGMDGWEQQEEEEQDACVLTGTNGTDSGWAQNGHGYGQVHAEHSGAGVQAQAQGQGQEELLATIAGDAGAGAGAGASLQLPSTREGAAEYLLQLLHGVQEGRDEARDELQRAAALLLSAVQQGAAEAAGPSSNGRNNSNNSSGVHAGDSAAVARDTPTKTPVDTTALRTPQRAPAAGPLKLGPSPSPSPMEASEEEQRGGEAEVAAAGVGTGSHTPEYRGSPAGTGARGQEEEAEEGDGGYAAALASMRSELQADFDARLAAHTAELEAHFEARLQVARTELRQQYEQQLAERDAEIEAQRLRCDELQDDLDQLLLCLGQESRKVSDLADAMRLAGLDPDAIILPIEEEYAMMDAAPADGEEEDVC